MSELTELVRQLVALDSVNPDLVPGGVGEQAIGRFVAECARGMPHENHLHASVDGTVNVS